ncbi:MAG: outer membrane beta-barrel protein, partial [Myxococcota bacterium]
SLKQLSMRTHQLPVGLSRPLWFACALVLTLGVMGVGVAHAAEPVDLEPDDVSSEPVELGEDPGAIDLGPASEPIDLSDEEEEEEEAPEAEPEPEIDTRTSQERLEDSIRVFQQRPIVKSGRFELALTGGLIASDTMFEHTLVSATGRFHISEWVSVGATYAKYFSTESTLFKEVTTDFELFPEISRVQWYAGGDVSVVPIDGKLVLFDDTIVYFDIYASIGGGVTKTNRSDSLKPTGMVGVGIRLFFAEWLSLTVELRDHLLFEEFKTGTELVNNVVGQAGFSIFLPFGFDYEYPR